MKVSDVLPRERADAVTLSELAGLLGVSERTVSNMISEERQAGIPICSSKGRKPGYWLTNNRTELEHCSNSLQRDGLARLKTASYLKKIVLSDEPEQQTIDEAYN